LGAKGFGKGVRKKKLGRGVTRYAPTKDAKKGGGDTREIKKKKAELRSFEGEEGHGEKKSNLGFLRQGFSNAFSAGP